MKDNNFVVIACLFFILSALIFTLIPNVEALGFAGSTKTSTVYNANENEAIMDESKSNSIPDGGGIVFFSTQKLEQLREFYVDRLGCELWLDQGACIILRFGNMLFAFCSSQKMEKDGLITFFFKSRDDVDTAYEGLKDIAVSPPKENKKYAIYHFYAKDPEGRSIEFQYFLHPIDWDVRIR